MLQELYNDWGIPWERNANGWLNTRCPFCGDTGLHLGSAPTSLYFHCWRCGWHPAIETLSQLTHQSPKEVGQILAHYHLQFGVIAKSKQEEPQVSIQPFKFPNPTSPLGAREKHYLSNRGFDPDKIERQWQIFATGPISLLDNINYKQRILIPIHWDLKTVSFQARDITGKSELRYIACPKPREIIHHKNIVYGDQSYWAISRVGIVVEGVTDVWKLGPAACATFGIEYKMEQVLAIANAMDRIFVIFDNEIQAQKQARKLAAQLKGLGKEVFIERITDKDPGCMNQDDADHLVCQLIGKQKRKGL